MIVKDLMSKNPITVSPESSFTEVWKKIFEKKVSGLPVVDKKNKLIGIISEEDCIEELYPSYEDYFFDPQYARNFEEMEDNIKDISNLKAKNIMNTNVYTTTEQTPIMKAAASMLVYKVSCLPVIEKKGMKKYVTGIICKGDIFSQLFLKVQQKERKQ